MNQRGFSLKKCMVGLVLAIAMVIQTPVSGFAADVCTQSNVVQAEGKVSQTRVNNVNAYYLGIPGECKTISGGPKLDIHLFSSELW